MEIQLASAIQYKIIQTVGKKLVLPLFMNNIADISTSLLSLKKTSGEKDIKEELKDTDLGHKIIAIGTFLKEVSDDCYNSNAVHIHLCGIYDVLEDIKEELQKVNEEYEYTNSWSYYYQFAFIYYRTRVDTQTIKKKIKLLDDRYDMLIKMMMVHKS